MISAFMIGLPGQWEPVNVPVEAKESAARGEDGAIPWQQREPHQAAAAEH
jgi:hypothetical protein